MVPPYSMVQSYAFCEEYVFINSLFLYIFIRKGLRGYAKRHYRLQDIIISALAANEKKLNCIVRK